MVLVSLLESFLDSSSEGDGMDVSRGALSTCESWSYIVSKKALVTENGSVDGRERKVLANRYGIGTMFL